MITKKQEPKQKPQPKAKKSVDTQLENDLKRLELNKQRYNEEIKKEDTNSALYNSKQEEKTYNSFKMRGNTNYKKVY